MPRSDPVRLRALAWGVASRLPWVVWQPLALAAATLLSLLPNGPVRQWQANVATLTGRRPGVGDTRRAVISWARNAVESMHLARWGPERINRVVVLDPEHRARLTGLAADPGAVLALPHTGSWDLAGVWACTNHMPVSSVAEQLGEAEFAVFLALREALGFRMYSHRDPRALVHLIADSREGRLVCLLADRDFSRRGVPVQWPTPGGLVPATMPPGPAQIALRAGSVLLGLAPHYEGRHLRLVVSAPITPRHGLETVADQVADMTQQLCDFFAEQIRAHPHDWHMLQPFFRHGATAPVEGR